MPSPPALKAARKLGVKQHECFETVDLFEEKDIPLVVTCLYGVGAAAQKENPALEPKLGSVRTKGKALSVVKNVREGAGFEAWRQLHIRFEPELESQKNTVLLELHSMEAARSIEETRGKLTELKVRITKAENIIGNL